jgi:hypothetical protein
MNSRAAILSGAAIFIAAGLWLSIVGWQKKWKTTGILMRIGGVVSLVAGGFCVMHARK